MSPLTDATCHQLSKHRYLFFGAGEAGIGIAELLSAAIVQQTGCTLQEARQCSWFVDSKGDQKHIPFSDLVNRILMEMFLFFPGLISSDRASNLEEHKLHYAHDKAALLPHFSAKDKTASLLDAVKLIKPTALIGVSAQGGAFTQQVCEEMTKNDANPLIYALSNPTTKAECTAEQAYTWTDGEPVISYMFFIVFTGLALLQASACSRVAVPLQM